MLSYIDWLLPTWLLGSVIVIWPTATVTKQIGKNFVLCYRILCHVVLGELWRYLLPQKSKIVSFCAVRIFRILMSILCCRLIWTMFSQSQQFMIESRRRGPELGSRKCPSKSTSSMRLAYLYTGLIVVAKRRAEGSQGIV